ncbi:hypothetical protein ACQ5ES_09990 [Pseudidiomarina sp. E22-M8]|uniref:hypothetical protein n=1 Tax=Pseudidiomarina sp. E22-M8 TaxID=3424768 RepID=UPI00403C9DAC
MLVISVTAGAARIISLVGLIKQLKIRELVVVYRQCSDNWRRTVAERAATRIVHAILERFFGDGIRDDKGAEHWVTNNVIWCRC